MRFALVALTASIASCSSSPSTVEHASIADLGYFIPTGWTSRDLSTHQREMAEWTPSDNEGKVSISIVHTDPRPALAKAGVARLELLLDQAQRSLPRGRFAPPTRFATRHGFSGARIEGVFVPPGQTEPYRRLHAVLLDGTSLVHVVLTAREADREAFEIVVESLNRKGA